MAVYVGRNAVGDQHTVVDDDQAIDNLGDRADGMVNQHDRQAGGMLGAQYVNELLNFRRIKAGERFVEQQQRRTRDQRARDFQEADLGRNRVISAGWFANWANRTACSGCHVASARPLALWPLSPTRPPSIAFS